MALLEWRNRAHGLVLSQLDAYILDFASVTTLGWRAHGLVTYLWWQAGERLHALESASGPCETTAFELGTE